MDCRLILVLSLAIFSGSASAAANLTDAQIQAQFLQPLVDLVTAIEIGFVQLTMSDCNLIKAFLHYDTSQLTAGGLPNMTGVTVDLYTPSKVVTFNFSSNMAQDLLASADFNKSNPVIIFTPGYSATRVSPISRNMGTRLATIPGVNVLVVDPINALGYFYYYSAAVVRTFGEKLGNMLGDLKTAGVPKFHAIGHSLGAHISSFAAKTFYNKTGVKLDRISGLDPAGPCFFDEKPSLKLNANDAAFVDVIHSDIGTFGICEPCGHVDFYPNGGTAQPGCLAFMCSHNKSWEFFHESIAYKDNFPAVDCADWFTFKTGVCSNNTRISMGYYVPTTARGPHYFLKTNPIPLYGLGSNGIVTPQTVDFWTAVLMWFKNLFGIK